MSTWYKVAKYSLVIEPVEVIKSSLHRITVLDPHKGGKARERQHSKNSEYSTFFEYWADAHKFLIEREEEKLRAANEDALEFTDNLSKIRQYKSPA